MILFDSLVKQLSLSLYIYIYIYIYRREECDFGYVRHDDALVKYRAKGLHIMRIPVSRKQMASLWARKVIPLTT